MPIHLGATDYPKIITFFITSKLGRVHATPPANLSPPERDVWMGQQRDAARRRTFRQTLNGLRGFKKRQRQKELSPNAGQYPFANNPGENVMAYGEWWTYFRPGTPFYNFLMQCAGTAGVTVLLIYHNSDNNRLKRVEVDTRGQPGGCIHTLWTDS